MKLQKSHQAKRETEVAERSCTKKQKSLWVKRMDVKIASLVGGTIATSVASGKWCAQLKNHRRSCTQPLRSSTPSPLPQFTEAVRRRLSTGGAQSKGVLRATARFEYKGGNTFTLFQDREESESADVCSSAASLSAIQSTTLDRIRTAGVIACLRAER